MFYYMAYNRTWYFSGVILPFRLDVSYLLDIGLLVLCTICFSLIRAQVIAYAIVDMQYVYECRTRFCSFSALTLI